MDDSYTPILTDEERTALRKQRAQARKRKQRARRRRQMKQFLPVAVLAVFLMILLSAWKLRHAEETEPAPDTPTTPAVMPEAEIPDETAHVPYSVSAAENTVRLDDTLSSEYVVLIDLAEDTMIAEKNADAIINPASMTKLLTLLVAAEHITDLDDTFTMTIEITDYCYANDCSVVGLDVGETVPIRELLYGTILPSGADASLGLAYYVSGSHEAFVGLMNEKLEELGLSDTAHFTNCVGLYDENHFCSVYDMSIILKAVMDNELCREILKARTYETLPTAEHPEGQILSNWFLRRIEDKDTGDIEVIGAKTGYVVQSGSCAASCGQDADGNLYLCVTGNAANSWQAIYDHVELYKTYCG